MSQSPETESVERTQRSSYNVHDMSVGWKKNYTRAILIDCGKLIQPSLVLTNVEMAFGGITRAALRRK